MAVFATHVVLMRDFQAVAFAPGDELPEWAEGKVGDHCLVPEPEASDADGSGTQDAAEDEDPAEDQTDSETDEPESEDEPQAPAADVPDFTAPAPVRRGSRTRK
ncbi:hypothetical protein ACFVWT_04335 [Arthrobacter sp. NPDC058288]|uniref:hypothetical protein n=1 Tax=Arthrobacter sp. NPDC058288 TaxID=3346424 RepID=UPI0036EF7E8A